MTLVSIILPFRRCRTGGAVLLISLAAGSCGGSPTAPPPPPPAAIVLGCPAAIEMASPGGAPLPVVYSVPVASGGTAPITVTCTPTSGSTFPVGATPVTCTATDAASRRATCGFGVTVTAQPVLTHERFLAFGDSLTEGKLSITPTLLIDSPAHSYPAQLEAALVERYAGQPISIANEGFGGERVSDSLARFTAALSTHQPQSVLLLHGVNDLTGLTEVNAAAIQSAVDGLEELIKEARRRGLTVFVATLPPLGPPKAGCRECVPPFNERLAQMAAAKGAGLVDVYAAWGDRPGLMGADGIHPTEAGYGVIAVAFFRAIRDALEAPLQ